MLDCYTVSAKSAIPIFVLTETDFPKWLKQQSAFPKNWLSSNNYKGERDKFISIPNESGQVEKVVYCVSNPNHFWCVGCFPLLLPFNHYELILTDEMNYFHFALAWGLGAYQFSKYKKVLRQPSKLLLTQSAKQINEMVESIYYVRNLINTPADDMGPTELEHEARQLAKLFKTNMTQIKGTELIRQHYPLIYTVGRASDDPPRLIDLTWGNKKYPKVVLVGKGVCFDTGGLDIKTSPYMLLMKKDMAGAAHILGLARMVMQAHLKINLRVLIPAVENAISGNAYRPGDIIQSRKGLTIEIGNTDAEGRLVLADALAEASNDKPDLIIDISTLTGAARVALGTDLPALFCNDDKLANELISIGNRENDPFWRMPLFAPYREALNTPFADINNCSQESYAGAITAALFLQEFVNKDIPWVHLDMMAWNLRAKPGRPQGGEAMGLRTLFAYLSERYS